MVGEYTLYVKARTKNNWVQVLGNMNGETAGEKYRNGGKIKKEQREHTYAQPSKQLFPKRWPLSGPNRTRNNMNKHNKLKKR